MKSSHLDSLFCPINGPPMAMDEFLYVLDNDHLPVVDTL